MTAPALDAAFAADLRVQQPSYFSSYRVRYERFRDVAAFEAAARARPGDAVAQANLGLALFARRDLARARAQADRALALEPHLGEAHLLRGELGLALKDARAARAGYRAAIAAGLDGYEIRARLGLAELKAGDLPAAERELRRAADLDREQDEPLRELAEGLDHAGRHGEALAALEEVARRNPQLYDPLKRLVAEHALAGRWDRVRAFAPLALNVNPHAADVHLAFGRALAKGGDRAQAIFELESALLCPDADRTVIRRELDGLRRR